MTAGKLPVILLAGVVATGTALVGRKLLYKPPGRNSVTAVAPPVADPSPRAESNDQLAARLKAELADLQSQVELRVKSDPKNADLRMQAARAYLQLGAAPLALPHLQVAARLKPKDPITWIALGDTATLANKLEIAEAGYQHAEVLDPGNAFIYRGRGQVLVRRRNLPGAAKVLRAGLARHPQDPELRTALGNVLILLNDGEGARKTLSPALEQEPSRADLHFLMGRAYEQLRQLKAAEAEMRQATELDPQRDDAFGRLGLYRVSLADYEQAREPLLQAIRLNPQEPHYFWALGDSYALDSKAADLPRAIELYREALKIDPANNNAMRSLMLVLTRRGGQSDLEEAVTLLKRLVRNDPTDYNAYYKLAETYRRLGRTEEAARASAKFQALSHAQQYSEAGAKPAAISPQERLRLGRAAMKRGDFRQAASHLQAALEADPRSTEVRAEMEKVSRKLAESQP